MRAAAALLGLLVVLAVASPATAATLHLTETAGTGFPERSYLLTSNTNQRLPVDKISVRENGMPVNGLQVVPTRQLSGDTFGTVLVIDTSESMHGEPIDRAIAAARAFAQRRDPRQPLGLLLFNGASRIALPLTTDAKKIDRALAVPPYLGNGTLIYDAAARAMKMLDDARSTAGTVIVLSDGDDTGSKTSAATVTRQARAAHYRVFTVGFRSRAFSPTTLRTLAAGSGGRYDEASSAAALPDVYQRLGTELANQYLLSYRSERSLGSKVSVVAKVAGVGRATSGYVAPALPQSSPVGSGSGDSFWDSTAAELVVVALGALLLGFGAYALMAPRASVRTRVGQFVTPPTAGDERAWTEALVERALGEPEGRPAAWRTWVADEQQLELAKISTPPTQVTLWTAAGTLALGWLLWDSTDSVIGAVLALSLPFGVRSGIGLLAGRQRRAFDEQLPDNLQVIASAMRAGHTFLGALGVVVESAPQPSRREFRRVLADEQLGVPLGTAMDRVAIRMASHDFEHVALVASLQSETGGNAAEVIDRVTETIRERMDLRRMVRSLTAQGRLAGIVISMLPIVLMVVISLINPGYMHPLFHRAAGIALLVLAAVMLASGALLIRRIVNIEI